jgi:hypothetical protein
MTTEPVVQDGQRAGPAGVDEAADESPLTFLQRMRVWTPRALAAGIVASLLIHFAIMIIAGQIRFSHAQAGGAGPISAVEMAIATESELAEIEKALLDAEPPPVPDVPTPELPSLEITDTPGGDEATSLIESADVGAEVGAGDIGGGELGVGGSGGGAASFFGVEAKGTRFAYIVDISGSMALSGKIELLRQELSRSIESLLENAEFLVALYNNNATPLGGRDQWTEASPAGKRWARAALSKVTAGGPTNPLPGFELVFSRRPRPDAVYFMTDGEFDSEIAVQIMRLNSEVRIPIHCITFVNPDAEELMRRIATHSGGTYTHVSGPNP